MAPMILAVLGLLIAPVFSVQTQAVTPLTCIDKASDGTTFKSANYLWHIECNIDYFGNDIKTSQQPTFELCIAECDANKACVDLSYVGDNCYMKKALSDTSSPHGSCWTARRATQPNVPETKGESGPFSCIDKKDDGALYRTPSSVFKVVCGVDYAGNDLPSTHTDSFEACIDACSAVKACVDVSYVWGACYMKDKVGAPNEVGHVWSAVRQTTETPQIPVTPGTPTPDTPTAPAVPLTCQNKLSDKEFKSPSGGLYLIQCGIDYAGGDLSAKTVGSFEDCIEECDKDSHCVDVSYVYGSCYLKNKLNEPVAVSHVWTAKVLKPAKDTFAFPTAIPQDIGSGTETMMELPIVLPPAPTAILSPVSPPGINLGGLGVLTPETTAKMWYNGDDAENAEGGATTVRLSIDYQYPSIILEYSMYIKDITCSAKGLSGRFDTSQTLTPYLYAVSTWPQNSKIIFITAASSCTPGKQNGYFLAENVKFDDATQAFHATGALAELADLYTKMDIDFGSVIADQPKEPEFDGTVACGSPDQTVLNGLPALACGPDFDNRLDKLLTFYSDDITDAELILAAAVPETGLAIRGRPVKRGFWGSVFKVFVAVVKVVVKVVVQVAKVVAQVVAVVVQKAVALVVSVAQKVVAISVAIAVNAVKLLVFIVTGNYSNKLTLPINMGPPSSMKTESPWGPAVKFYTFKRGKSDTKWSAEALALDHLIGLIGVEKEPEPGVELWCVNCGITGKIVAEGSISATPLSGMTRGTIGVSGNMYAGLYLGVNAFAKFEKTFEKELLKKGLPGWSIPGVVTLGPQLILALEATIGVEAQGQLITGASLTWPAFEAKLDFVDRTKSTRSGWIPVIDTKFQAHGQLEASAALGLPITVEFGIDILNGVFKKSVSLVDTPAVVATAEFSIDVGTHKNDIGTDDCYGIGWDIKLTNEVKLEIADVAELVLTQWESPALAEGCIGWPKPNQVPEDPKVTVVPVIPTLPEIPEDVHLSCPSATGTTYTDLAGNNYDMKCGFDYPGFDISWHNTPYLDDCINACKNVPACVGISFRRTVVVPGTENCWLKSAVANPVAYNNPGIGGQVDSAFIMSPFRIHNVIYSNRDITGPAIARFAKGNKLLIDTNQLASIAGDPWPGNPKSISMLYSYGAEQRIFTGRDGMGVVTINPGPVVAPSSIVPYFPPSYGNNWLEIVGMTYGPSAINNQAVANNLYSHSVSNRNWQFTNTNFGIDTWGGIVKTGVVWYRDVYHAEGRGRGDLYYMTARENDFGSWWRPTSKRSVEWSKPVLASRQEGLFNVTQPQLNGAGNATGNATWSNTTTPIATPSATPVSLFSNNTLPIENTTTPIAEPTATPIPLFANTTLPIENTTALAAPFLNTTVPLNSTELTNTTLPVTLAPFANTTLPSNTTLNSTLSTGPDPVFLPVNVLDSTGLLKLNAGKNGNLFLSDPSSGTDITSLTSSNLLAAVSSTTIAIVGDDTDRYLHYYPFTMSSHGASRLRLAALSSLPKSAKLVSLAQFEGTGGEKMLMGVNAKAEYFFVVMCAIQGQLNKIFLVKDVDAAPAVLEAEDAKFTITGGKASSCIPLAMVVQ